MMNAEQQQKTPTETNKLSFIYIFILFKEPNVKAKKKKNDVFTLGEVWVIFLLFIIQSVLLGLGRVYQQRWWILNKTSSGRYHSV